MIQNTSPLEAEISFCFMNDSKGETYLLDPPNMTLKPGEQQVLNNLLFTVTMLKLSMMVIWPYSRECLDFRYP